MAAQDRSLRQKRVAGVMVLGAILGAAWIATSIYRLFEPALEAYVTTTTTATGAAGLEAGSAVLYGGAPRGHITSIETTLPADGATGEIRIAFALDRTLPLAKNASIVRSAGVAGGGGALSVLAPGDPALAFVGADPRVIPMNRGTVAPPDATMVLLGRRNAETLRSIEASLQDFDDELNPRIVRAAKVYRSIRRLLQQLELEVESDDLERATEMRLAAILLRLQSGLPELQRTLISSNNAARALEREVREDGGRIPRRTGVASRNLAIMQTNADDIRSVTDATLVPKVLQIRRESLQAALDAERLFADGSAVLSEASSSIPKILANMKLAGGQLTLALDDLLGLALEAIMIAPDVDSATRRRLLEAVDLSVRAGMDVRMAADRIRNLAELDPSFLADQPGAPNSRVEAFQTAVDRLEAILDQLSRTLAEAVIADVDVRPTPVP